MSLKEMSRELLIQEVSILHRTIDRLELELQAAALLLASERERNPDYKPPEGNSPDRCRSEFREIANNHRRFSGKGLHAYLEDCQIFVPDLELVKMKPGYRARALRGYAQVLAVWDDDKNECLGWIKKENLREQG